MLHKQLQFYDAGKWHFLLPSFFCLREQQKSFLHNTNFKKALKEYFSLSWLKKKKLVHRNRNSKTLTPHEFILFFLQLKKPKSVKTAIFKDFSQNWVLPLSHAFLHSTKPVTGRFREVQPQYTLHSQRPFPALHQGTLRTFTHAAFEESSAVAHPPVPTCRVSVYTVHPPHPESGEGKAYSTPKQWPPRGLKEDYTCSRTTPCSRAPVSSQPLAGAHHTPHTLRRCPPRARRCPTRAAVRRLTLLHLCVLSSRSAHFPSRGTEQI